VLLLFFGFEIFFPQFLLCGRDFRQDGIFLLLLFWRQFVGQAASRNRQHVQKRARAAALRYLQSIALAVHGNKEVGCFRENAAGLCQHACSAGFCLEGASSQKLKLFDCVLEALAGLPAGTVVDGEVVAIDESGRPNFNLLQNFRAEASRIQYYVFDLLCWKDRDLTRVPLVERRALLKSVVVIRDKRIRIADYFEAAPKDLLSAVRQQGLEGIIGKRKDSVYQPGKRSGAWIKYRVNRGQEFVIGGYFPGPHGIDSLIVGYYDGDKLIYAARTRNGLVPASRRQVFSKLKHLVTPACPFVNLPETRRSRFGEELNAEKMKNAIWLRPQTVAQIEFLEWTEGNRLRHSKFVGLREDKDPRSVVKEQAGEA
jgi:ATP-dependent DNA ligase